MLVDRRTAINRKKSNCIVHVLRRKCLLTHIIEGKIEGIRRREIVYRQILEHLKEMTRYWKLNIYILTVIIYFCYIYSFI